MSRERYRYSIGNPILVSKRKTYCIEKVKWVSYCIVKGENIYQIGLIATWRSPYEGSLLFISKISKADSVKFKRIKSLGGRQYQLEYH